MTVDKLTNKLIDFMSLLLFA